jgi:hypothetical protein
MKTPQVYSTSRIYLFPPDQIPFAILSTQKGSQALIAKFQFQSNEAVPDLAGAGGALAYDRGIFERGKPLAISRLHISQRNIQFEVNGESEDADAVYAAVVETMKSVDKSFAPTVLTFSEQASCVVKLDIDFDSIFDKRFLAALKEKVTADCVVNGLTPLMEIRKFSASISYAQPQVTDGGISIVPKPLTLEPRTGTPLGDRVFFVSAPTSTPKLLELCRSVESALKA